MNASFTRFALVGAVATVTTYVVLIFGVEALGVSATAASIAGYTLGIFVNYLLNYRYTFNTNKQHAVVFPKFLAVMLVGMIANAAIMIACHELAGLHYLVAQLIAIAIVLLWSFTANRLWTFSA
jgi:putative flippase GtrA